MPNSFGKLFTITTWGESHGPCVGVVVDGCPPLLPLAAEEIQAELDRRRPGQSDIVTPRDEPDRVEILSGVFEGRATGAPIALLVRNADQRPAAYDDMREKFRPSHADFAYQAKYGIRDHRGGGRSSARETIARVAAGAIAKKILAHAGANKNTANNTANTANAASTANVANAAATAATASATSVTSAASATSATSAAATASAANAGIEIRAYVTRIHDIAMPADLVMTGAGARPLPFPAQSEIESNPVRCPHAPTAAAMIERIKQTRAAGDSVGGVIQCRVRGVPAGLGEPVFDRLEADLAKAMLSIPATKGFEIGSGFAGTLLKGSEHNDAWISNKGRTHTETNRSGGIQGGISNGAEIFFNVAFKPTATIARPQRTIDTRGAPVDLIGHGRHDPCVLPRAVPIVEAMTALVLVDHLLRHHAQNGTFQF